jgi:hypothetical protein
METKICEMCESAMKLIPSGISRKTGKHYNAFWACQNPDCKHTLNIGEEGKAPKEPSWSPKILKAEEDVKIMMKLADLELKLDFIISKIKEKEEK